MKPRLAPEGPFHLTGCERAFKLGIRYCMRQVGDVLNIANLVSPTRVCEQRPCSVASDDLGLVRVNVEVA